SDIRQWQVDSVFGSVSGQTSGTVGPDGSFSGTTTLRDNRRIVTTYYDSFFLADETGATREVVAANVRPMIGEGHLVSAAWLVHNRKTGNAFVVYDHTTNQAYCEVTRRQMHAARRGLTRMVLRPPTAYLVILCLAIVTIPLVAVFGLSAHMHLTIFRKRTVKPLLMALDRRASEFTSTRRQTFA